ncbi:hypothetical protein LIA77_03883 [Sarocladium implicatum]|nr:hypothetical protein LIA77_03883 [Sarocladium implicatum]
MNSDPRVYWHCANRHDVTTCRTLQHPLLPQPDAFRTPRIASPQLQVSSGTWAIHFTPIIDIGFGQACTHVYEVAAKREEIRASPRPQHSACTGQLEPLQLKAIQGLTCSKFSEWLLRPPTSLLDNGRSSVARRLRANEILHSQLAADVFRTRPINPTSAPTDTVASCASGQGACHGPWSSTPARLNEHFGRLLHCMQFAHYPRAYAVHLLAMA